MPTSFAEFECARCGHHWKSRKGVTPVRCASCKSPYWNRPRREAAPQGQGKSKAARDVEPADSEKDEDPDWFAPVSQNTPASALVTPQLDSRSQVESFEENEDIDSFLASTQGQHPRNRHTAAELFTDAELLLNLALEDLEAGRIRNAAEKAWGATKRATDGMLTARTGREPRSTGATSRQLGQIALTNPSVQLLRDKYQSAEQGLHGRCFYDGECPPDVIAADVRRTAEFIREARRLANPST